MLPRARVQGDHELGHQGSETAPVPTSCSGSELESQKGQEIIIITIIIIMTIILLKLG